MRERKRRKKNRKASLHSVLLVLWCRVIFSYDGEQHGAVKAIISAAAQSSLTTTSLSQQRETHTCAHACTLQFNEHCFLKAGITVEPTSVHLTATTSQMPLHNMILSKKQMTVKTLFLP